ncbi:venom phosphodiesterase 2 [Cocos nucifera]|nr:venom phosphodiesterase 2 [Cocos nucifera]
MGSPSSTSHWREDPSKPLLHPTSSTRRYCTTLFCSCLVLLALLAIASAASWRSASAPTARPLSKLSRPVVIIVSADGFRFGYQFKTQTPNIRRLIAGGTEAEEGLIPVFPSLTFPNHYSIATGLYPPYHGIINNYFTDPVTGDWFTTASHEPHWWLGEPLWQTAAAQGVAAATYFWPGSEVIKGSWTCPPKFCPKYNGSVPFEQRVDTLLGFFDLPGDEVPALMMLYMEQPDLQGHEFGPDDPEVTKGVARVDRMIGRLIAGLEERGIFEDVTMIMLGDHGMVGTCRKKTIFLDDLAPWVQIPESWVQSYSPLLAIRPPAEVCSSDVVAKMNEGLSSGEVENGEYLRMFLKEDLPERLHYSASSRIPPIIGILGEAYTVVQNRTSEYSECGGAHGYDNALFSMRTIFMAHGPRFERGRKIPSFKNVEIYNLVTTILNLKGAPNNGSASFPNSVLLPST